MRKMDCPTRFPCRRRLIQMMLGRRVRGYWLIVTALMLLVWLNTHHSIHLAEEQAEIPHSAFYSAVLSVEHNDKEELASMMAPAWGEEPYKNESMMTELITMSMENIQFMSTHVQNEENMQFKSTQISKMEDLRLQFTPTQNWNTFLHQISVSQGRGKFEDNSFRLSFNEDMTNTTMNTNNENSTNHEWDLVLRERKMLLQKSCEKLSWRYPKETLYRIHSIVDQKHKLFYCPVEKVASTFMRRFAYSLVHANHFQRIPSPFQIPIVKALDYEFTTLRKLQILGENNFLEKSVKFILVRDPYTRLFSSYVDKLLVPNVYYWKQWAIPAISKYRSAPTEHALKCGHDVTFTEFLKQVISKLQFSDPHIKAAAHLCFPCQADFNVIGHLETFKEDFSYLISVLNVSLTDFSFETLSIDLAIDAIVDSTFSAFHSFLKLEECISKSDMGRRLWKKMQIRGIISDEYDFPLSDFEMETMTLANQFIQILDKARRNTSQDLHHQRFKAIQEAFATVPSDVLKKITQIYSVDFEMFGYDKYPNFIL